MVNVKVRMRSTPHRWHFVGMDGRLVRLVIHAVAHRDRDAACASAEDILASNPETVAAARVVEDGRTLARFGEPTPPKPASPVYGAEGGFAYLVSARNGRGTFHVRNPDGTWGSVTSEVYEACHDEAKRAGLDRSRLNVHGSISTIWTRGLHFTQRSNRPDLDYGRG